MKFERLLNLVGELAFFDLPLIVQLSGEPKQQLVVQLHQWVQKRKLIRLRRGIYAWNEAYRKIPLSSLQVSNELYKPSYLSGVWALSYYGLIPEKVPMFTNVTTRVTRTFKNELGLFLYSNLKRGLFWGFVLEKMEGVPVNLATPEKALLDFFYLHPGEWSHKRLLEMRFQNLEQVNEQKLVAYAHRSRSLRLVKIVDCFRKQILEDQEGLISL